MNSIMAVPGEIHSVAVLSPQLYNLVKLLEYLLLVKSGQLNQKPHRCMIKVNIGTMTDSAAASWT